MHRRGRSSPYRDAFRLLFRYCESERGRRPAQLELSDLDAPVVIGFLDWLEKKRGNAVRSRNARLAALKSFMNYAAGQAPACLPSIQRVLALPTKRWEKPLLGFLSREEVDALLAEPQRGTWIGERDYMFLSIAYNTGARVTELVDLTIQSIDLERRCVRIIGKGRKLREIPLWDKTMNALRTWLRHCGTDSNAPVFPTRSGQRMTRSNVEKRMTRMVLAQRSAAPRFPVVA